MTALKEFLGGGLKQIESWGKPLRVHLQCPLLQYIFHRRGEGLAIFVRFLAALRASGPVAQGALQNTIFMVQILESCVKLGSLLQNLADFRLVILVLCSSGLNSWHGCGGGVIDQKFVL